LAASASATPTTLATGSATPRQFIGGDLAVFVAIHSLQGCGDVLDLVSRQRAIAVAVEDHDQRVSARTASSASSARTASSGSTLAALRGTVGTPGSTVATLCRATTFAVAGSVGVAFCIGPFAFCIGPFAFGTGPFAFCIGPFAFGTGPFAFDIGPFAFDIGPVASCIVAFCGRLIPLGRSIGGPFVCGCWQAEHDPQAEYGGCGDQ
jgi:hypothetical protein